MDKNSIPKLTRVVSGSKQIKICLASILSSLLVGFSAESKVEVVSPNEPPVERESNDATGQKSLPMERGVEAKSSKGRSRREVPRQWSFGVGPAAASSLNVDGGGILWNVGYIYEMNTQWDMHLDFDWLTSNRHFESDATFASLNFGLNHYFIDDEASPFLEGHLGYAWSAVSTGCAQSSLFCNSSDKGRGWSLGGGLGYRFFRSAATNFSIVLRGAMVTSKTDRTETTPIISSIMIIGYFN